MKNKCNSFTLIEVVVALGILAISLAGLLQLLTQSQLRIARAEERWREMHILTQAAEYLLLAGNTEELTMPDEFFPYPDYSIEWTIEEAEGLPEEFKDQSGQMELKKWQIRLLDAKEGKECAKIIIDRFDYDGNENNASTGK